MRGGYLVAANSRSRPIVLLAVVASSIVMLWASRALSANAALTPANAARVAGTLIGGHALQSNWSDLIDQKLEDLLKDPYSAVKRVTRAPRYTAVPVDRKGDIEGWAVCYSINSKNSYGGYVGSKRFLFVITPDDNVEVIEEDPAKMWQNDILKKECSTPATPIPNPSDNDASGSNPKRGI